MTIEIYLSTDKQQFLYQHVVEKAHIYISKIIEIIKIKKGEKLYYTFKNKVERKC